MYVGWGEGMDRVAAYLNRQPEPESLRVRTWYGEGPLTYFFRGAVGDIPTERLNEEQVESWAETDYAVVYVTRWQRVPADSPVRAFFEGLTPEHTVSINSIPYARIYRIRDVPLPPDMMPLGAPQQN
jgi:hypothetical protein